jgi:cytochrome c oxidase subunit 2
VQEIALPSKSRAPRSLPFFTTLVASAGALSALWFPLAAAESAAARRVEIVASRYEFTPSVVEARQGETLELVLRSADTDHGLAIKPYGVKVKVPKGGEAVTVTLVADKPGRFRMECSEYCGSGHKRMRGELVVAEEASR